MQAKMNSKRKYMVGLGLILTVMIAAGSLAEDAPLTSVDRRVDSLFVIASSGVLQYRNSPEQAVAFDSIVAMGAEAVPRLVEKYRSKRARERHTVNDILVEIGSAAVPYLTTSLADEDSRQVNRICYTLGEIGDSLAVPDLIRAANHQDWWVRSGCAGALGKIGDTAANATVMSLLADSVELVRKAAVVAAGKLMIEDGLEAIVHCLGDKFYGVRMCASEALIKFGRRAVKPIVDSLGSGNILLGNLGCTTLGLIGGDLAAFNVAPQLESVRPIRRALAVEAIENSNSSLACGFVDLLKETESDPLVLFFIEKTLKKYAER
jgi:HEAT repeat protein